jgi:nicotinate-nucleotide pyrophosphorylase (carboxylating)
MVVAQELDLERIALSALAEDVGRGDLTTEATVAEDATCTARLLLKEPGVVCGLPAVEAVFRSLDPNVSVASSAEDRDRFEQPTELARISGRTRAVLTGERTALNLLGRLSGIATLTRRFVDAIEGTGAEILDTRKTTPGLRALEKYAVRCGAGGITASASMTESSSRTTICAPRGGPAVGPLRRRKRLPPRSRPRRRTCAGGRRGAERSC